MAESSCTVHLAVFMCGRTVAVVHVAYVSRMQEDLFGKRRSQLGVPRMDLTADLGAFGSECRNTCRGAVK